MIYRIGSLFKVLCSQNGMEQAFIAGLVKSENQEKMHVATHCAYQRLRIVLASARN